MFTFKNETKKDIQVTSDSRLYTVEAGEVFQTNNKELADEMARTEGLRPGLTDGSGSQVPETHDRGAVDEGQDPAVENEGE